MIGRRSQSKDYAFQATPGIDFYRLMPTKDVKAQSFDKKLPVVSDVTPILSIESHRFLPVFSIHLIDSIITLPFPIDNYSLNKKVN